MAKAAAKAPPAPGGGPQPQPEAPAVRAQKIKATLPQPPGAPADKPTPVSDDAVAVLKLLLRVEAEFRKVTRESELSVLAVNEIRKLSRARQVVLMRLGGSHPVADRISSVASFDQNAPFVRWLEKSTRRALAAEAFGKTKTFRLDELATPEEREGQNYPFNYAIWIPARFVGGAIFGGFVALREVPWTDGDIAIGDRLAETFGHAATALKAGRLKPGSPIARRLLLVISAAAIAAALFLPVPMSALAPAEVVPANPNVIAAPVDGVVAEIEVPPNARVRTGDVLVRFVDTVQRNQLKVAEREVEVAEARLRQTTQAALFDDKAKRELAIARAELQLKLAERDFARENLAFTLLRAPVDGIAVYSDRKDWLSRPVSAGQRIIDIANPDRTELRIDLPVADAVVLKVGAPVRVFFDSDPLKPRHAAVTIAAHSARVGEGNALAYRMVARFDDNDGPARAGWRGTAQVFGETVPLGYYVFRKPLAWLRQKSGL